MVWADQVSKTCRGGGCARPWRVVAVALAVMGMGTAMVCSRGVEVVNAHRVRGYVPVEAKVVEVGVGRGGSRREPFVPRVRYTYSAGGQWYEQSAFGPTPPWFKTERAALVWLAGDGVQVGGVVEAYRDPVDPSRAVLTTHADPERVTQSVVALVVGGVMALGGASVVGTKAWRWSRRGGVAGGLSVA